MLSEHWLFAQEKEKRETGGVGEGVPCRVCQALSSCFMEGARRLAEAASSSEGKEGLSRGTLQAPRICGRLLAKRLNYE